MVAMTVVVSSLVELLVPTLLVVVGGVVITAGARTVVEVEAVAVIILGTVEESTAGDWLVMTMTTYNEVAAADAAEVGNK